jgi:kynureninase
VAYRCGVAAGSLDDSAELDAADPLARFVARVSRPDRAIVYMDGNSLGAPRDATMEAITARVDEWRRRLVGGWADWIELPSRIGDLLGATVLGAAAGQVVVSDSTTVNIYKLAAAALDARPHRRGVVVDTDEFPSDRYVLAGLADRRGLELQTTVDDETALVLRSHVDFRTGQLHDMAAETALAHSHGALTLWDTSHSAGVVDVRLDQAGADLAVGCTYKYLGAGPGAPAFLYVRRELVGGLRSPIQGWFGQSDQFAMGPRYQPLAGIGRFLTGTPNVLDLASIEAAVATVAEAGIDQIRAKSARLTAHAIAAAESELSALGFELATPREADRRGGHVALRHPDAWRICRALIEHQAVVPDFREPDILRLGMPPLTTTFGDVTEAIMRTRDAVERGLHLGYDSARSRVT